MSTSLSKNLETDFVNLCITPEPKIRMRSRSFSFGVNKCSKVINTKRRKSFIFPSRVRCYKKDSQKTVLRPAKLKLASITKKSSLIRPAKLNIKESKMFLLKPATLIVEDKRKPAKSSKFVISRVTQPGFPLSVGQVFKSCKPNSQSSFKSLATNEDTEISKAFDTLSFKKLRQTKSPSSDVLTTNKRENTSSCSIQARMESSVPVDCDDTSIEELASYFDLFVHIPKKMSSMAEMMYI